MKSVFKYLLKDEHRQTFVLSKGSKILTIESSGNYGYLYALVNPDEKEKEERTILLFDFRDTIENSEQLKYLGSYQLHDGAIIKHVFEELEGSVTEDLKMVYINKAPYLIRYKRKGVLTVYVINAGESYKKGYACYSVFVNGVSNSKWTISFADLMTELEGYSDHSFIDYTGKFVYADLI